MITRISHITIVECSKYLKRSKLTVLLLQKRICTESTVSTVELACRLICSGSEPETPGGKRLILASSRDFNALTHGLLFFYLNFLLLPLFSLHQGLNAISSLSFCLSPFLLKPFRDPSQPAWGPSSCPCRCTHKGMKERERWEKGRKKRGESKLARKKEIAILSFLFLFLEDIRRKEKERKKERASVRGLADPGHVAETPRISALFVWS